MRLSFLVAGPVGSLQAYQTKQRRGLAALDSQGGVRRVMSESLAGMVIVIPLEHKGTEDAIQWERRPAFALFSRFGLIGSIDLLRRCLQQEGHQCGGGLEESRSNQHLQLLHRHPAGPGVLESGYELLDFLLLGEEDLRGKGFFLEPAAMAVRVCSMTSSAYCSVRVWNCL